MEFKTDHTLTRFGKGTLDFQNITKEKLIEWLKKVGINCADSIESINEARDKPEGEIENILGYELNSRWSNKLHKYLDLNEYKLIKFENMKEYKVIIGGDNKICWIEDE